MDGDRVAGIYQCVRNGETDTPGATGHKGGARRGVRIGHCHASIAELRMLENSQVGGSDYTKRSPAKIPFLRDERLPVIRIQKRLT